MDLADASTVRNFDLQIRPGVIINPAGYNAVDNAERNVEMLIRVNRGAPTVMARNEIDWRAFVRFLTKYVCDGRE